MKRFFVLFLVICMAIVGSFADDGISFASDSTIVAGVPLDGSDFSLVLNPNASATLKMGPCTFVTTGNASFDALNFDLTSVTLKQKLDVVFGIVEFYVTPTAEFIGGFAYTLPASLVVSGIPHTTITTAYDFKNIVLNELGSISVTAEIIF